MLICLIVINQVWAKRRFKTPQKYLRAKYRREFELNEKIVSNTLWARLEPNGRLVVGAVTKKQPAKRPQSAASPSETEAAPLTAAGNEGNDRNHDHEAETMTSLPPEVGAMQFPDILVTCTPGAVDNGRCSSPKK